MKPSCQEARFPQKSEIQLKGTKVRASSNSSNAERVMFGKSGVTFLPRHLEVTWSQLVLSVRRMVQSQLPGWHFKSQCTLRACIVHFSQLELRASGNYLQG